MTVTLIVAVYVGPGPSRTAPTIHSVGQEKVDRKAKKRCAVALTLQVRMRVTLDIPLMNIDLRTRHHNDHMKSTSHSRVDDVGPPISEEYTPSW